MDSLIKERNWVEKSNDELQSNAQKLLEKEMQKFKIPMYEKF